MLTGYDYFNLSLDGAAARGHIWADSELRHIKWLNADATQTPWHGMFEITRNGLFLAFDAFYGFDHERPVLTWTKLDLADSCDYVGTDCEGRVVRLRPVCRFLYDEATGTWNHKHLWCPRCQMFTVIAADCHFLQPPRPLAAAQPLQPPPLAVCRGPRCIPIESAESVGNPWDEDTDEEDTDEEDRDTRTPTPRVGWSEVHPWRQGQQSCPWP